jgi:hypothetical protein
MQSLPQTASTSQLASSGSLKNPRRREDLLYQAMTIAAMLIVLVTVWVF